MEQHNPLLSGRFGTHCEVPPFDIIKTEHYEPALLDAIKSADSEIDAIATNPDTPTFENTILALEREGADLNRVLGVFGPMLSAMNTPEMMEISMRVQPVLSAHYTSVSLNRRLWERVKYVKEHAPADLDDIDRRLLDRTYRIFVRSGALVPDDKREEYQAVSAELAQLTTQFSQNVLKAINAITIELTAEEADGLPPHVLEEGRELAAEQGKPEGIYLFTVHQPVYMAMMKFIHRRDVRERVYRAYVSRNIDGEFSNIPVLKRIVELRAKFAELLGQPTVSHHILTETMAKTPENVMKLLNDLHDSYDEAAHREVASLEEFARRSEGESFTLMPWDYSYWFNLQRKSLYDYDEQKLRPYFELNKVIDGVFGLATRLYGVHFTPNDTLPIYHPDVKTFDVTDSDGTHLGVLYTDFFPRSTKSPGAWMTEFKGQWHEPDGSDSRPVISIVMNFTKPTATEPSLLTPNEVRTFLHEFGHALHGLLSKVRYESMSGTNVYRDFVELPSQFNENFLTKKEFLDSFAIHYKTGEPIPVGEVAKLVESSQFGAAYACFRQLSFGLLDMAYHSLTPEQSQINDVVAFERKAVASVKLLPEVDNSLVSPQFSHIFAGGYASGYYSYKWSEVLDADAFAVFEREGVFNRDTAMRFRREILERGSSDDPDRLYRNFKGGDPTVDALLKRDGVI